MREDELEKLENKLNRVIAECYYLFCDYDLTVNETVSVLSSIIASMMTTSVDKQDLLRILMSVFGSLEKTIGVKVKGETIIVSTGYEDETI